MFKLNKNTHMIDVWTDRQKKVIIIKFPAGLQEAYKIHNLAVNYQQS